MSGQASLIMLCDSKVDVLGTSVYVMDKEKPIVYLAG